MDANSRSFKLLKRSVMRSVENGQLHPDEPLPKRLTRIEEKKKKQIQRRKHPEPGSSWKELGLSNELYNLQIYFD